MKITLSGRSVFVPIWLVIFIVLLCAAVILVSASRPPTSAPATRTPRPSPQPTLQPTIQPTVVAVQQCPPAATTTPIAIRPRRATYVLIDQTESYDPDRGEATQVLKEVLSRTLLPGDMIAVSLIGYGAPVQVVKFTQLDVVATPIPPTRAPLRASATPNFPATKSPQPSATVTPTIGPATKAILEAVKAAESGTIAAASATAGHIQTIEASSASNRATALASNDMAIASCIESARVEEEKRGIGEWSRRQQTVLSEQLARIAASIDSTRTLPAQFNQYTYIASALSAASGFFQSAKRDYQITDLYLLIFSDMDEQISADRSDPALTDIDLQGVRALAAMVPYPNGDITKYTFRKKLWEQRLQKSLGGTIDFLPKSDSTAGQIINFIGRQR